MPRKRKRSRGASPAKAALPAKKQQRLLDISHMSYRELQKNAKALGIRANQSKAKLISALSKSLKNSSNAEVEKGLAAQHANVIVPKPLKEHSRCKLKVIDGQLWTGKHPDQEDVLQGKISNCYFVCALTLLAQLTPEAIERCFVVGPSKKKGHRYFRIQIYRGRDRASRRPDRGDIEYAFKRISVTCDNRFYVDRSGGELYTHSENGSMWPGLLEKAYIKMRGRTSYREIEGDINNEGNVVRVVRAVEPRLGCLIEPLNEYGDHSRLLRRRLSGGKYVAWCAGSRPHNPPSCSVLDEGGGKYIYGNHAYLVEGLYQKDDEDFAIIRNPHNRDGDFDATANPELLPTIRLDTDKIDGSLPLNEDGMVGAALIPLTEFSNYFLIFSCFSWIVPRDSAPIHA